MRNEVTIEPNRRLIVRVAMRRAGKVLGHVEVSRFLGVRWLPYGAHRDANWRVSTYFTWDELDRFVKGELELSELKVTGRSRRHRAL